MSHLFNHRKGKRFKWFSRQIARFFPLPFLVFSVTTSLSEETPLMLYSWCCCTSPGKWENITKYDLTSRREATSSSRVWGTVEPFLRAISLIGLLSQSFSQSINQSINQSASQSVRQTGNKSVRQTDGQSVRQTISQTVRQSVSQSASQSVSLPVS